MLTATPVDERMARWMRARGEGSIESFKDALAWMLPPGSDTSGRSTGASETANALQWLSAVDFDWVKRSWRARSLAIFGFAGKNYAGFIAGVASAVQRAKLHELERGDVGNVVIETSIRSDKPLASPPTHYVIGNASADLEEAGQHLGCPYSPDAALLISDALSPLSAYRSSFREILVPDRVRIEFLTPNQATFWSPVERTHERGLHRLRADIGPKLFLLWDGERLVRVHDRQVGVYEHLRIRGERAIAYDVAASRVFVPRWAVPPAPQARCLVACSGQLPRQRFDVAWAGANFYFENVPEEVALAVATSLEQELRRGSWS